jgi:TonB family protein
MKNKDSLIMVLLILIVLGCKCQSDLFNSGKKSVSENEEISEPFTNSAVSTADNAETVSVGNLTDKAISLPMPQYPAAAKAAGAQGKVEVNISVDTNGNVVSAEAVSGHPLLRSAAANAARQAKFPPPDLDGKPANIKGVLTYTFTL